MKIFKISIQRKGFFLGFLLGILFAAIFLILSLLLPTLTSSFYNQKRLGHLRSQAQSIKNEFAELIHSVNQKQKLLPILSFPDKRNEIFNTFKKLDIDRAKEGVSYINSDGDLILWLGNIADLKALFFSENKDILSEPKSSFVIRHKASVYLVSARKAQGDGYVTFYRLLAFTPQLKTPYLKEYHFLKAKLLSNSDIDYWDFREDVSGFERIFSRHQDEYTGQPRRQEQIETIVFPLRNEENKIMATVTLSSPSLSAKIAGQKENVLLISYILLGLSLLSLLIHLVKLPSFFREPKLSTGLFVILALIGFRLIVFPLSKIEKIQSLSIFSPSAASFFSVWDFTKSPADIFLTFLLLASIIVCLAVYFRSLFENKKKDLSFPWVLTISIVFVFISLFIIFAFQEIVFRLVSNSNINLLRYSLTLSFFLLHLSIVLLFVASFLAVFIGARVIFRYSSKLVLPSIIFLLEFGAYVVLYRNRNLPLLFVLQASVVVLIFCLVRFQNLLKRKEILFLALCLSTLFLYASLHYSSSSRNRSLIQNSLQNVIRSQENWGVFLLNQSLQDLDKRKESIISFLKNTKSFDLAHSLWERTLIAKFNWYSSLEVLSPEGAILSRFSLNVPKLYHADIDLPPSREWSIVHLKIPFMAEEKAFLLGYRDWLEEERLLGRTILYLSVDYDMLPFLYSANPYFELLRMTSIPSLNQFDFGFATFDLNGKLLFNPNDISSGIPPGLLKKINSSQDSLWASYKDKRRKFQSFYFWKDNRIYSLFMPKKNFLKYTAEFLRLLFFYFLVSVFLLLLISILLGKKFKSPFWSFSNRVYISLVAATLIPLLLFTFFTRSFFAQIFSRQFTDKAEAQAILAQRIMEDFILFQQEEMVSPIIPSENVVLWISSAISNDVNLYQNGRLISSSRREFFDYGLLPDLIDGEIYYKIQFENNPFYTQTQKIGDYSFHTLTAPFFLEDSLLLLSLPFPLEQQEISSATEELVEFLLFITVFFIAAVIIFARSIGSTIITPIKKLLIGTKEVSLGNLEVSIPHKHQDEMKTLIDGFNTMVKNLKKQQQELAEMSKKAAWAEMARKIAHEIKNPLTPIQLSAEHLLRVYEDKKKNFDKTLKESAFYIIREVENLRKIAQDFLEISKETALQKEPFDLKALLQETVLPYKKMLAERIKLNEKYEGRDFYFVGDKSKLKIALRNILINAIEAIHNEGEIKIRLAKDENGFAITITDTGAGMKKEILEKIFEPYFSTKDVGTGLGLPIAKKIIEDHGGSIQASSKENKGTQIRIHLPQTE